MELAGCKNIGLSVKGLTQRMVKSVVNKNESTLACRLMRKEAQILCNGVLKYEIMLMVLYITQYL